MPTRTSSLGDGGWCSTRPYGYAWVKMTNFVGGVLPSGAKGDPPMLPPKNSCRPPFSSLYRGRRAFLQRHLTNNLPVSELPVGFAGFTIRQFERRWYHQIHLLPGKIILGNLL